MAIQIQGTLGSIIEVDGPNTRCLRVVARPTDYGWMGQYCVSLQSGTMASGLAAGSEVFQLRWTATPSLAVIWGVSIDGMAGGTASFSAGPGLFMLSVARSWTVDGSGGTQAVLTGNNQTMRSSMAPSLMGGVRISSTGALSAGTKTYDAQGLGGSYFAVSATASTNYISQVGLYGSMSLEEGGNCSPIILSQYEGVGIAATVPGSATWRFGATVLWSEVDAY
jgi:hypothetical protein